MTGFWVFLGLIFLTAGLNGIKAKEKKTVVYVRFPSMQKLRAECLEAFRKLGMHWSTQLVFDEDSQWLCLQKQNGKLEPLDEFMLSGHGGPDKDICLSLELGASDSREWLFFSELVRSERIHSAPITGCEEIKMYEYRSAA